MFQNYYSQESLIDLLCKPETLLVLPLDTSCIPGKPGAIGTGLDSLGEPGIHEVWALSGAKIHRGQSGRCQWSQCDKVVAAAIWLDAVQCQDLKSATEQAYSELLELIVRLGYPHPLRFWNYIADINNGDGDQEAYKQFCAGRLRAFTDQGMVAGQFPAASALGHHRQGAVIYVLAGQEPATHHYNTMQVNAYDYPRQYGASSPSFSRATSIRFGAKLCYFLSGTASIVGHESTCLDSLQGQVRTTVDNLKHLLSQDGVRTLNLQTMKVYLRYADDYSQTQQLLESYFPGIAKLFVLSDICRSELLVEIECYCGE
ncbi:MAG: hypothetical protein GXP21_02000 [Gammaproteobacteria bacterium]|nr:hypothetical protein [Gammaproteobacteria bacterium]